MKKSIFLFFAAILCAIGMNAADIPAGTKFYLKPNSNWGGARYAVYFYGNGDAWVSMQLAPGETNIYEVTSPNKVYKNLIFCRMNPDASANNWDNKWNQTNDLTYDGTKNFYTVKEETWDKGGGTWSTYTYTPPTLYIAGDFVTPQWSENAAANKMDYADGVYSKSYNDVAASAHQFKITNGTWTNAIGYDNNKCSGTNCTVENGGGNIKFTPLAEGTVTITYTLADGKVHITCPEPPAAEYNITYPTTQTNYTLVAGAVKAQAGAEVSFTATPADGYVLNVTYNGNAITGNNNVYAFMMPAADVTIAIEAVAATTLYYVDHNSWGNANAYMWNDSGNNGWPGVAMTSVGTVGENNYAYYSVSFAQGTYTSIIFNNGSGSQTSDLTINTEKPYFYDGAWYTWDELLAKLAAPVVTYDYYVIGTINNWGLKDENFGMTDEDADGVYEKVITLADGKNQLKINKGEWKDGEIWGYDQLAAQYEGVSRGKDGDDNNIIIDITPGKDITIKFDKNTSKITLEGLTPYVVPLTYTVTVPAGTEKCFIAGAMNGWNFQEMTATANANEFTIEIAGARETDGYKYACQASWDYVEKKEDGNDLDANRTWTANDVVAKWGVPPTYTIVGATAITGANWDLANEANKMIKDGEAYTLTKTGLKLETGDYEYKVAKNGAWGDGQYPAEGNQKVTITETAEYTIVYTYNVGTSLTAVASKTGEYTPAQTVYTVAGDAALCGTNWQADDATNDMTANGDGTFTWTKADVKLTSNVGFKVVKNHDFGNGQYPAENWNINLVDYKGAAVYTVTITFTESSKEIAVTLTKTGEATPPVISYVLMGVDADWTTGIELTRNEANTEFEEYMLLGQAISATDAVKVVKLVDGEKNTFCGDVKDGSAEHTADADGNIVLAEGTYDFYYDVPANKVYIGKQVPATATITLVDAGDLGAILTLSADEYVVGDEITASAAIYDDGFAFAYWKEGENIVSYSADYTFVVTGDRTLEAYFGGNMPVEMADLAVDGDAMTITGSNTMEGIATALVLDNYDRDTKMWSVNASASTISYYGTPLTILYSEVWLDTEAFSMAMARVVADFGGELFVFNLTMTAAGETLEVGVATELSLEFGALVMRGTWYDENDVEYPFEAQVGGFDYTKAEQECMTTVSLGNFDDDTNWLGMAQGLMTVTVADGTVELTGTVTTMSPINTLNIVAQGNIQILPMDIDVTVEEMDMGDAVYLKLNGTDYESGIDIELYLNDYTGADKTYELNEASSIAGGAAQAMGSLTKAGNTYTGVAYASAMGALYVLELNLTEFVPEYENIVVTGLSGAAEARSLGWGNEYYLALSLEGTWSDGVVTYPVSVELADYDPAVTSGTTYVTLSIGGWEDDQEWLGSIDGGEMNFSISGKTITLTGKLDNAYNWPAPIYWDLTITGTILPNYTRDVTADNFGTLCLPFGGTVEGAELYELVKAETDGVLLGSVNKLEAGVPYVFKATASQLAVYCDDTVADEAGASNGLYGTFDDNTEVAAGNYILKDNALCQAEATCYVDANRAYVVWSEIPTTHTPMPGRRYIGMGVHGENGTTGLDNIMTTDAPVKAIENGQLIIIRGGEKFNAMGVKL